MVIMRLKGIKVARAKGRVYYYHRATGERIKAEFGTAAFVDEARRLDEKAAGKAKPGKNTLGALIIAYKASPEWQGLRERTRADYEKVFEWFDKGCELSLSQLTPPIVIGLRDKANRQHKRRFANYVVTVISLLCNWGKPRGWIDANPAHRMPKIRRPRGALKINRAWTDEERIVVLEAAKGGLKVGIALGMFAALARVDIVNWPRDGYTGQRIVGTRRKTGEPVNVLCHPVLKELIENRPFPEAKTLVTTEKGLGYSEEGFATLFFRLVKRLETEGKVAPGLSIHGLRHTYGKTLAETWADARTIARAIGDKTTAMGEHYSREARLDDSVDEAIKRAQKRMWK